MGANLPECKELLDLAYPQIYQENALRVTGLPCDADARKVRKHLKEAEAELEWGAPDESSTHLFALSPAPDIDAQRKAVRTLGEPVNRVVQEFFWFWPFEWGEGYKDPALEAVARGDAASAISVWHRAEKESDTTKRIVGAHNLAVAYHLMELDGELKLLNASAASKHMSLIEKYWQTSFERWERLARDHDFWLLYQKRVDSFDEPRLKGGFVERFKVTFPDALDQINGEMALLYAESQREEHASRHVRYMHQTHQGMDDVSKTLERVAKPIIARLRESIDALKRECSGSKAEAPNRILSFLGTAAKSLSALDHLFPGEDHRRTDEADNVAQNCLQIYDEASLDQRSNGAWQKVFSHLFVLAHSQSVQERIKEAAKNGELVPFMKIFDLLRAINDRSTRNLLKLADFRKEVHPALLATAQEVSGTNRIPDAVADAVSDWLRNIAIDAHNTDQDMQTSLEAMKLAIQWTGNEEKRSSLRTEMTQLEDSFRSNQFMEEIERIFTMPQSPSNRWPSLKAIVERERPLSEEKALIAASKLRELAIAVANEQGYFREAIEILEFAQETISSAVSKKFRPSNESAEISALIQQLSSQILQDIHLLQNNILLRNQADATGQTAAADPGEEDYTGCGCLLLGLFILWVISQLN